MTSCHLCNIHVRNPYIQREIFFLKAAARTVTRRTFVHLAGAEQELKQLNPPSRCNSGPPSFSLFHLFSRVTMCHLEGFRKTCGIIDVE